MQNLG